MGKFRPVSAEGNRQTNECQVLGEEKQFQSCVGSSIFIHDTKDTSLHDDANGSNRRPLWLGLVTGTDKNDIVTTVI